MKSGHFSWKAVWLCGNLSIYAQHVVVFSFENVVLQQYVYAAFNQNWIMKFLVPFFSQQRFWELFTNVVFLFIGVRSEKRWFSCLFSEFVMKSNRHMQQGYSGCTSQNMSNILNLHFSFRPQRRNSQKREAEKGNQTSNLRAAKVI